MENILKNIVIALIIILVVAMIAFFWKMTPRKQDSASIKIPTKEKEAATMPKQLQFRTGFETYKKSDKKESSGSAVRSIDYFKINK